MRWDDARASTNIEDRRGDGGGGGGGFSIPGGGGGGLGIGVILILGIIGYATGIDPRILIGGAEILTGNGDGGQMMQQGQYSAPQQQSRPTGPPTDQMGKFVSAVLGETEDVWTQVLPAQKGVQYVDPRLVLYTGETRSGCGTAQSAMGPFYCPIDHKVYLDMAFFNDMRSKLGGGGDFAYAYVIAHEIGHHVQNLLGLLGRSQDAQQNASSRAQANSISVRVELSADCLAGVWAANADQKWKILQPGDIDKALSTASAIGDDRLQQASRGQVVPDSFTHGSSAQRQQALTAGLKSGQVDTCIANLR